MTHDQIVLLCLGGFIMIVLIGWALFEHQADKAYKRKRDELYDRLHSLNGSRIPRRRD
jgi:hypothetical protein